MNVYVPAEDGDEVGYGMVVKRATTADLVAALREEGVGATMILDHDLPDGFEIIPNDVREPYMENGRYLVVRIDGEET